MKIFKVDFSSAPGAPQAAIILAENKENAIKITEKATGYKYTTAFNDDNESYSELFTIKEVKNEEGIVYTGYNCC